MGLLNVRLDHELERKVKALRDEGVVISDLLRSAILNAYEHRKPKRNKSPSQIIRDIHARYPDENGDPPTPVDAADRRSVQSHIRSRLLRKRR